MEALKDLVDPLLDRAEAYSKTSFELLRLKALDKTASVSATLFSRFILILVISFFTILLNIGIALWLGDLLGKAYYGFFIVAGFYAIAAVVFILIHPSLKARVNNTIVKELFN